MKLENIRTNFSFMEEEEKRQFFLTHFDSRKFDLESTQLVEVKTKQSKKSSYKKKNDTLTVTPEQLEMLKLLGLV
jgi:hypothetical protein